MSYEAETVANAFLLTADNHGYRINAMKLQKLLYLVQGGSLSLLDRAMISDDCLCGDYGPIFKSVFHELRRWGIDLIKEWIVDDSDPDRFDPRRHIDEQDWAMIRAVWRKAGRYDACYLSEIAANKEGPWDQTRQKFSLFSPKIIPKSLLRDYFLDLLKPDSTDQTNKETP